MLASKCATPCAIYIQRRQGQPHASVAGARLQREWKVPASPQGAREVPASPGGARKRIQAKLGSKTHLSLQATAAFRPSSCLQNRPGMAWHGSGLTECVTAAWLPRGWLLGCVCTSEFTIGFSLPSVARPVASFCGAQPASQPAMSPACLRSCAASSALLALLFDHSRRPSPVVAFCSGA